MNRFLGIVLLLTAAALSLQAQTYEYDDAGRLVRAVYPGGGGAVYAYDEADNMTAQMPIDVPPAPMIIDVTRTSSTEARVRWQAVSGAEGYVVERRLKGTEQWEQVAQVAGDVLTFVDTELTANTEYDYRVAALGSDGKGAFSEPVGTDSFVGPELTNLIPRLAASDGFITTFQVINLTDNPTDFQIDFLGAAGAALALPIADGQGGVSETASSQSGVVPGGGAVFFETFPAGALVAGYAVLEEGAGDLAVTTSITQLVPNRDPFQSATPMIGSQPEWRLPFTNQRPFTAVLALTNQDANSQDARLVARGADGVERCSNTVSLGPGAHAALVLQEQLPCSANSIGLLEILSDGVGVGPIAFSFHDLGPFTTNLPAAVGALDPSQRLIPRIANGDAFESVFEVSNTGQSTTAYRISFYASNGAPLSLPIADEAGNQSGETTALTGSVPAGGVAVERSFPTGETIAGYAILETGAGDVSVNTTITQLVPDRDPFQAAVPLAATAENQRLPFTNLRPFTTVMAWTNPDGGTKSVKLTARGLDGVERCSDTRDLAGLAHDAFVVQERLPCAVGAQGVLEITASNGGVAAISFVFHDLGPFTTNLPAKVE